MENIVIMGPPGAGKGTVCQRIKSEMRYNYISTGDILRSEKSSGSDLGKRIAKLIDSGNLVPDELVTEIVSDEISRLRSNGNPFLVDGYPRTVQQAKSLEDMMTVDRIIWIEVSDETTIQRNLKRGKISGRPDDSNLEVIKKRIDNYKIDSVPIKDYWRNRVSVVSGEMSQEEVFSKITTILNNP
jgi:adenylate kinase